MFGKKRQETKQNYTHEYVDGLKKEIKSLNNMIDELNILNGRELTKIKFDHELEIKKLTNEVEQKVDEKVKDTLTRLTITEQENAVVKKELEVYNKAFENMGMDVKDVKDVVNKLVDGLVAKSEIKLVKA